MPPRPGQGAVLLSILEKRCCHLLRYGHHVRTLYHNGIVHAPADHELHAVLVVDDTIAWIGHEHEAGSFRDAADEVVDLNGALIAPAFVDAHAHILETGLALTGLDLTPARSATSVLDAVATAAPDHSPLLGFGWDETAWTDARPPHRQELDNASKGAVVYLSRVGLHSAVISTRLAEMAGCAEAPGWHESGLVTGEAHHLACRAVRKVTMAHRESLYRTALTAAAAAGIAGLHEHSVPDLDTRNGLSKLLELTEVPSSGLPAVAGYRAELCASVNDARELLETIPRLTGIGGDLNVDGSIESRTAALRAPYTDDSSIRGALTLTAEQIANHVTAATRAGVQAAFHVIGDRAMDEALLGFQAAAEVEGVEVMRAARHRLEHAQMIDASALARILLLGLTISSQPASDALRGGPHGAYATRLGPGRAANINPFADLAQAGVPLAFGSDTPVASLDPWAAIKAAAGHHESDQRLPAAVAFHAHSAGGWLAQRALRASAGELRVGAPASLAIWRVAQLAQPEPIRPGMWRIEPTQLPLPLPDLSDGVPAPVCLRTVRDGTIIYDTLH